MSGGESSFQYNVYGQLFEVSRKYVPLVEALVVSSETLREIKLLRHMDHENISLNDVYIVYELMDTDLQRILRSNQTLSHDQCPCKSNLILSELSEDSSTANILHRDLRPSNVLLNSKHELKIGDFGIARTTSLLQTQIS
ncbi:hypothetical protein BRARA_C02318 [Brassica rapa]|uniref:Protein kinase domain-containing protein n=1 Tax=Brassica campestris TaxID=3711 RepID=A0A397ZZ92_BRACM|nr:hypothetical protein BRARA_C02318 [Brassica rapa]